MLQRSQRSLSRSAPSSSSSFFWWHRFKPPLLRHLSRHRESYLANVNYAAGISMGMSASRAFTNGEPFSDDIFQQRLKTIISSEVLMACRTVECRMQWGVKFAEAMAKKAMAKKANLPQVPDLHVPAHRY